MLGECFDSGSQHFGHSGQSPHTTTGREPVRLIEVARPTALATSVSTALSHGTPVAAAVVRSNSSRSLGVHSNAVQSAANVSSLTWTGWRVSNAETETADNSRFALSASNRRNWAPVQTSRWAAAIRSRQ